MLPTVSMYAKAQEAAQIICHILANELRLKYPEKFQLVEHGQFTWLLAVMDDLHLDGSMAKYTQDATVHRLSTALDGLPVYLSNHSGLRYGVLISGKPHLPGSVDFPEAMPEKDVMPLGMGLTGPIHAHAAQIMNAIIVGVQDSGKSMALRALAHSARLHGSILYLADPGLHTFVPKLWERVTACPVAQNKNELIQMLDLITAEIMKRIQLFDDAAPNSVPPEDIDKYNELTGDSLPRVWMIVDEANSLLGSSIVKEKLAQPAQIGRKYGVHLVLAGHDWHEKTVERGLTAQFDTRLCLRTSNNTMGQIVLDSHIRGKRTMAFNHPGRAVLRLRHHYRDVQLYFLAPEREDAWFSEIPPVERKRWESIEQSTVSSEKLSDEIARMAESIRSQWNPEMSKSEVSRLFGKELTGTIWFGKINEVIKYLASTPTPNVQAFEPNLGALGSK